MPAINPIAKSKPSSPSSFNSRKGEDFFGVQAKLNIGKSNDKYEVEADKVADTVVSNKKNIAPAPFFAASPAIQNKLTTETHPENKNSEIQKKTVSEGVSPVVQPKLKVVHNKAAAPEPFFNASPVIQNKRDNEIQKKPLATSITPVQLQSIQKCDCEKESNKNKIQKKTLAASITPVQQLQSVQKCDCEKENVQKKEENGAQSETSNSDFENKLNNSKGGGSALSEDTKAEMESGFGVDFSNVRIHNDSNAVQMSQEIGAQAFASGNDIYFNEGKYNPDSASGKHLLAHELTHTIQQGNSPVAKIQRYSFDEFMNDASNTVDAVDQGISDVGNSIADTASDVGNAISDTASDAIDWIKTEAGEAALALANAVLSRFGGSITIVGSSIIIDIPNVTLFDSFQKELGDDELPAIPVLEIPIFGETVGVFTFLASLEVNLQPSILAALGPGELRQIRLTLDPLSSTFAGQAELYVAASIGERLSIFGGLVGRGLGVIPSEPPIPLEASLEGGIRGTGTGWGIGAISSLINVGYSSGTWSFSADNDIMMGVLLQGDVDLYASSKVFEHLVCEYAHPLGHWEIGDAYKINIPVSLGGTAPPSIGPITSGPMPVGDIETAIEPLSSGLNCKRLQEIVNELCEEGLLPKDVCDTIKEIIDGIEETGDDVVKDLGIEPLSDKSCDDLPDSYRYKSYKDAEKELKRRAGIPESKQLYRNDKKATSGPCPRVGRHYNLWDNSAKKGEPVGAIGMCPCTIVDKVGNEVKVERYAVLNAASAEILAKKWGCTDVRCNVYQIPGSGATCPDRVIGNADYKYSSFDDACKAAQKDANSKVPAGCNKRHCNCDTKCSQK